MNFDFSFSGTFDPVAFYAAVLSTMIGVWEWIKWKARHSVDVRCNANMLFIPSRDRNKYVVANVTNTGTTATTITHFAFYYWENLFDKFFNKERKSFIVNSDQIPKVLQPGEQLMAQAIQTEELETMAAKGRLYGVIIHSMSKKEVLHRVIISKKEDKAKS